MTPHSRIGIGDWPRGVALMAGFHLLYMVLHYLQFYHWNISDGVLFAVLWASGRRWWPWLFAGTIAARVSMGVWGALVNGISGPLMGLWTGWAQFLVGSWPEPFLVATGMLALHQWGTRPGSVIDARAMVRLHLAAAISALAVVANDVVYVVNDGFVADVKRAVIYGAIPLGGPDMWQVLLHFSIKNCMGYFIGIMLVMPMACWWLSPGERGDSRPILERSLGLALPAAILFVAMGAFVTGRQLAELLRLLLLTAVAITAVRDGWRGAAIAILAVSVAVAIDDHVAVSSADPVQLQMFIAITGAMGLMFGAAVDELRRQRAGLMLARADAARLASELSAAAIGNLRVEEAERRRIAGELHDEFGQNLTVLQLQLHVAGERLRGHGAAADGLDGLQDIVGVMREGISRVIERLRPVALDELGLYGAIDRSGLRCMAERAGLDFRTRIEGDARLLVQLDEAHRIAAYRLVQEAVNNCVRHAQATACCVRLRIERRRALLWLFVDVRDNGIGDAGALRCGNGLRTMHDRVTAMDGRLHLGNARPGLRVHVLLRQSLRD